MVRLLSEQPFPLSSPWRRRTGTGADLASAAVDGTKKPMRHLTILFSTWWPGLEIGPGLSPSPCLQTVIARRLRPRGPLFLS
ncbi:hypothetical protein B296_00002801 [Ensete ventricosum]|uniref:Uncharacterized protein n=1 Tax=Ensete ventricosum TaxID=4639 RepID=A0A426YNL1_ENSVE|nr:hypothetical protein B296_00002801 [Ensete ventricosum]